MAAAETPSSPSPKSSDGVFSLEDLDKIIESEDPNFKKDMADIRTIGAEIKADIETLDVDGESSTEGADTELSEDIETTRKEKILAFILKPWRKLKAYLTLKRIAIKNWSLAAIDETKTFVRHELPERLKFYKAQTIKFFQWFGSTCSSIWKQFVSLSKTQKITLLITTLLAVAALYIFKNMLAGKGLPKFSDPLISSLEEGASFVRAYKTREDLQDLFHAFPEVEFHVLLTKVIVNLKPDANSSANPMGAFEVYLGVDSQDTAIEVKDREKELMDITQRVLERFSYSETTTVVGKVRIKSMIRDRVNEVLNQGRVFHVYFNTFVVNP